MKINTSRKSYKKLLLATGAVMLVAAVGYGTYASTTNHWPFVASQQAASNNTSPETATSSPDQTSTAPVDTENTTGSDKTTTPTSPKTPDNNDSPNKPTSDKVGVTITSITTNDNAVQVRSLIEAVTSSGSCTLTFSKNGTNVVKTSGIQALPSSSTCKGFSIPLGELSKGTWNVTLNVTADNKTGSATASFEVN